MKVVIDCVFIRKVSVGSNHWLKRRNAYTFSNDSDNSMHNKQHRNEDISFTGIVISDGDIRHVISKIQKNKNYKELYL